MAVGVGEAIAVGVGVCAAVGVGVVSGDGVGVMEAAAVGVIDASAGGEALGAGVAGVGPRTSTRTSVAVTSLQMRWVKKYRSADCGLRPARVGCHFSSRVNS